MMGDGRINCTTVTTTAAAPGHVEDPSAVEIRYRAIN
jgi:hypothetical protein